MSWIFLKYLFCMYFSSLILKFNKNFYFMTTNAVTFLPIWSCVDLNLDNQIEESNCQLNGHKMKQFNIIISVLNCVSPSLTDDNITRCYSALFGTLFYYFFIFIGSFLLHFYSSFYEHFIRIFF